MNSTIRNSFVGILLASFLAGCMLFDVKEQQEKLDSMCQLEGSVAAALREPVPIVALLLRRETADSPWTIADHFVLEQPGRWVFIAASGEYRLAAFADANADLIYQPGEAYVATDAARTFRCELGTRMDNIALSISSHLPRLDTEIDVTALQARSVTEQAYKTLGQLTVVGELISLTDERFSLANAANSLWRPFDAMLVTRPGVYFLEPYDPKKIPVLFVHGISDSPARFAYLIEHLDRKRFQPWVYSYPSGVHLNSVADHLDQTMTKLRVRHHIGRIAVVAHSMGGLVSRGYFLRDAVDRHMVKIPLFVSISTPWDGHEAAANGVKRAPEVVHVWRDMAPDSDYLRSLFAQLLPEGMKHHLVFTFRRDSGSFGESGDQSVTMASQLSMPAQREAERLHGFDDTHVGILGNAELSALLNRLLEEHY